MAEETLTPGALGSGGADVPMPVADAPMVLELLAAKRVRTIASLIVCVYGALNCEELMYDMGDVLWPVTSIPMASLATVIDEPVPLDTPGVSEAVVVPLPSRQVYGTKTGVVLDPRRVQLGRQKEMDQM